MNDLENKFVLATDLDGTFFHAEPGLGHAENPRLEAAEKDELYAFLRDNPNFILIFVSGRNPRLMKKKLDANPHIPRPDFMIGDVGATVSNSDYSPLEPLQAEIQALWDATEKEIQNVPGLDALTVQDDQMMERRLSFYVEPDNLPHNVIAELKTRDCNVLYSNEIYLDIRAPGVDKGSTLRKLMAHLGIPESNVMVAGDTMNDFDMYNNPANFKGVVLANSEQPLKDATKSKDNVYFSKEEGTKGILEALHHYKMT